MGQYNEGERSHKHAMRKDTVHDQHIKHEPHADGHLRAATDFLAANHREGDVWKVQKAKEVKYGK